MIVEADTAGSAKKISELNLYDKNGDYGFNLGVSGAPETYLVKKGKTPINWVE